MNLVDLGQGEAASQVGVSDVRVIIPKVVKGIIAAVGAVVEERARRRRQHIVDVGHVGSTMESEERGKREPCTTTLVKRRLCRGLG